MYFSLITHSINDKLFDIFLKEGDVLSEMISDYEDIAEYILKNYRNKVVEVGVGNRPEIAITLNGRMDVVVTDICNKEYAGIRFFMDDIFFPDICIYRNARLIYSIRPPIDIQEAIAKIAKQVGSDMLIRPFSNEKADLDSICRTCDLVNYGRARFYIYKF